MVRQKIIIEEGYRTDDVDGGIVTSMGLVESEKGGVRAFIDFDDNKGMATYNLSVKGDIAGSNADDGSRHIPGYLDFGKVNKSLQKQGYEPYIDIDAKEWGTEPEIVGQPIWIKCVKTSVDKDGKEYKSLIDVTKIGSETEIPTKPTAIATAKGSTLAKPIVKPTPTAKGTLTPELLESWKEICDVVLTQPLNETNINMAMKKQFPGKENEAIVKLLSDVRAKALAALVKDGVLEMDENAKYSKVNKVD